MEKIKYVKGDVYYNEEVDVIFNPVGVRESNGFITKVKKLYPEVFREYDEMVWMYNEKELLGEIQLINTFERRFMLNGFCIDKNGRINKLALVKTLIELCNLAYEYELTVGIEYQLGSEGAEGKWIGLIINEVFANSDVDVTLFDRKKK